MVICKGANNNDIIELIKLRIEFLKENNNVSYSEEDYISIEKNLRTYFIEHLSNNEYISWVAVIENEIIATSGLSFHNLPPSMINPTGRIAYIMNMYTKPSYRRQGIGTELFIRIIEEAKVLGYKKIELHATANGISIYKKQGFKEHTTIGLVKHIG